MQRFLLGILVLTAAAFPTGCKPAAVAPPAASVPVIPPGRATAPAGDSGGGAAAPTGRTPAIPK